MVQEHVRRLYDAVREHASGVQVQFSEVNEQIQVRGTAHRALLLVFELISYRHSLADTGACTDHGWRAY